MYKELVEGSIYNRNKIVSISEISPEPCGRERYVSLFSFDEGINGYVSINKSVKGYAGTLYASEFTFDVDCKNDLEVSRNNSVDLVSVLNSEYGISPDDLTYYFSGAKGFHIVIPGKIFGGFSPSAQLAQHFKDFALEFTDKVDNLDLHIYESVRLFRLPNSINSKSGLYKVELSFEELQNLSLDEIKEIAKKPRTDFQRPKALFNITRNNLLSIRWQSIISKVDTIDSDRNAAIRDEGFFAPPIDGDRNNTLYKQATMLFDLTNGKLHWKSVRQILSSINAASQHPIDAKELDNIIRSAEKRIERSGKIKPKDEVIWKTISEIIPQWEALVLDDSSRLYLGFPSLDANFEGKLRGKLIGIAGYGGSKKSLVAQQILNDNIEERGAVAMWSCMEMSATQALEREIDQIVDLGTSTSAAKEIKDYYKTDIETAKIAMYRDIGKKMGNSLFICDNARLNKEDYRRAIIENSAKAGKVDILLVDGLSMMDDSGTETEAYTRNSADLKEIAKEFNLLVILICHVAKGVGVFKHTRDLEAYIRGSQKIMDNVDAMIYMSLVVDKERSSQKITEYRKDVAYIRCYDKRGTGNTINIIADFIPHRLRLKESKDKPEYYE